VGKTNRLQSQGPLPVLVQVNIGQEDSKHGVNFNETPYLVEYIVDKCPNLLFKGLMGMGKIGDVKGFRDLTILRNTLLQQLIADKVILCEEDFVVSMGTSADYKEAVTHGATQVRLGTTIFGERKIKEVKEVKEAK
jgi:PLP dependent protein